jgi:hypothetical protein
MLKSPTAFVVRKAGRFGNNVLALHNAIAFAKTMGVKRIYMAPLRSLFVINPDFNNASVDGITVIGKGKPESSDIVLTPARLARREIEGFVMYSIV